MSCQIPTTTNRKRQSHSSSSSLKERERARERERVHICVFYLSCSFMVRFVVSFIAGLLRTQMRNLQPPNPRGPWHFPHPVRDSAAVADAVGRGEAVLLSLTIRTLIIR